MAVICIDQIVRRHLIHWQVDRAIFAKIILKDKNQNVFVKFHIGKKNLHIIVQDINQAFALHRSLANIEAKTVKLNTSQSLIEPPHQRTFCRETI